MNGESIFHFLYSTFGKNYKKIIRKSSKRVAMSIGFFFNFRTKHFRIALVLESKISQTIVRIKSKELFCC